jgi:hypothetical protein
MRRWSFIWSLLWAPLWIFVLHPWWRRRRFRSQSWVMGGHRGRAFEDNSRAVFEQARTLGRPAIWIARSDLASELRARGLEVLIQGSWSARQAISRARVLIYSHGEDDLDPVLPLLRGRSCTRVYLGHSLSLLKGGGVTDPIFVRAPAWRRALEMWLMTDCDVFLYSSERERQNFALCYPQHETKLAPGGGAHLDAWITGAKEPTKRRIYWFPTFRDTEEERAGLAAQIREVCDSTRLREWLLDRDFEFVVGIHINRGSDARKLQLRSPFREGDLSKLVEEARESELFISDYSGVVFDFLLLCRPQILFAFDLSSYRKSRHLLVDYERLNFAIHARTSEELVESIVSEAFLSKELQIRARESRREYLPALSGGFASSSVDAISRELEDFE